jgi:hypothetical protein
VNDLDAKADQEALAVSDEFKRWQRETRMKLANAPMKPMGKEAFADGRDHARSSDPFTGAGEPTWLSTNAAMRR